MATSVQDMARTGEELDIYYYDAETSKKQAFPTTQNTKYVQSFANLTGGSSVFTIPPQNGIQDVVCEFVMPALTNGAGDLTALALPRGWGYALINQVSFRYGGSTQYFLTGDQILQNALRKQTSRTSCDDILTLGGQYCTGAGGLPGNLDAANSCAVVLTLPHSTPSGVNKAHPLPSDLLTQQIQVTVELKRPADVFGIAAGSAVVPAIPNNSLTSAQFQVQQVMLNNQGDALARRVDMAVNAYSFPAEFVQQKVTLSAPSPAQTTQQFVLTGFRSGEVKAIHCWLSRSSEATTDPFKWYLPTSAVMTYAGDIYARYELASSPLWNLINGNKAPAVDTVATVVAAGPPPIFAAPAAYLSQWVELPFAQSLVDEDAHAILIHGKPITNGIINLTLEMPSVQPDWVLNVSYIYNTTLLFSQGTVDYVF